VSEAKSHCKICKNQFWDSVSH